jgi:hypothetical protein
MAKLTETRDAHLTLEVTPISGMFGASMNLGRSLLCWPTNRKQVIGTKSEIILCLEYSSFGS